MNLKKMILNELDNNEKGFSNQIAKLAGYSSGSALRKVLNDPKKEFGKFSGLIKVIQTLFPDNEKELLIEYSKSLDPNKQTARYMLEYLGVNSLHEPRKQLIKKLIDSNNIVSQRWGKLHLIDLQYANGEIDYLQALDEFSKYYSENSIEIRIKSAIFKAYCYLDRKIYDLAFHVIEPIKHLINKIDDEFIYESFLSRVLLIEAEYYARKNELKKAREKSLKVVELTQNGVYLSWAYLHLGNSYIMEDYDKSINYLSKGFKIVSGNNPKAEKEFKRSMNFLNNTWKRSPKFLNNSNENSDLHEIAYFYINNDNHEEAMNILNKVKNANPTDNELAFNYYLRGLITNEIKDFAFSVKYFNLSGDNYFKQLPLKKLKELGVNEYVVEVLGM